MPLKIKRSLLHNLLADKGYASWLTVLPGKNREDLFREFLTGLAKGPGEELTEKEVFDLAGRLEQEFFKSAEGIFSATLYSLLYELVKCFGFKKGLGEEFLRKVKALKADGDFNQIFFEDLITDFHLGKKPAEDTLPKKAEEIFVNLADKKYAAFEKQGMTNNGLQLTVIKDLAQKYVTEQKLTAQEEKVLKDFSYQEKQELVAAYHSLKPAVESKTTAPKERSTVVKNQPLMFRTLFSSGIRSSFGVMSTGAEREMLLTISKQFNRHYQEYNATQRQLFFESALTRSSCMRYSPHVTGYSSSPGFFDRRNGLAYRTWYKNFGHAKFIDEAQFCAVSLKFIDSAVKAGYKHLVGLSKEHLITLFKLYVAHEVEPKLTLQHFCHAFLCFTSWLPTSDNRVKNGLANEIDRMSVFIGLVKGVPETKSDVVHRNKQLISNVPLLLTEQQIRQILKSRQDAYVLSFGYTKKGFSQLQLSVLNFHGKVTYGTVDNLHYSRDESNLHPSKKTINRMIDHLQDAEVPHTSLSLRYYP